MEIRGCRVAEQLWQMAGDSGNPGMPCSGAVWQMAGDSGNPGMPCSGAVWQMAGDSGNPGMPCSGAARGSMASCFINFNNNSNGYLA